MTFKGLWRSSAQDKRRLAATPAATKNSADSSRASCRHCSSGVLRLGDIDLLWDAVQRTMLRVYRRFRETQSALEASRRKVLVAGVP
jgi:hypothetical protein